MCGGQWLLLNIISFITQNRKSQSRPQSRSATPSPGIRPPAPSAPQGYYVFGGLGTLSVCSGEKVVRARAGISASFLLSARYSLHIGDSHTIQPIITSSVRSYSSASSVLIMFPFVHDVVSCRGGVAQWGLATMGNVSRLTKKEKIVDHQPSIATHSCLCAEI